VLGHRGGGSGYLPGHTPEACERGIDPGAGFVEPDLAATGDAHLVARLEANPLDATNVKDSPQRAARKGTVILDGMPVTNFFASDFTLAEIKQSRAVQPLPERGQDFDGKLQIPAVEEIIDLVERKSAEKGRRIRIYPETKHPT
jgi:glycerophosphoryl diester phosphodiesterase